MNITCKYRKKLNLGLTTGPVDHVVVPPIDGFHADAVLAQRDDHHSLGARGVVILSLISDAGQVCAAAEAATRATMRPCMSVVMS